MPWCRTMSVEDLVNHGKKTDVDALLDYESFELALIARPTPRLVDCSGGFCWRGLRTQNTWES